MKFAITQKLQTLHVQHRLYECKFGQDFNSSDRESVNDSEIDEKDTQVRFYGQNK